MRGLCVCDLCFEWCVCDVCKRCVFSVPMDPPMDPFERVCVHVCVCVPLQETVQHLHLAAGLGQSTCAKCIMLS